MATITTINGSDQITNSRTVINTNFSNLNSDKIETSVLDTDTAMAANSDAKVATQKAVKTYIDTFGGANASETVRGIVEEATDAEVTAGTATGSTGAKLAVTPAKLATRLATILAAYQATVIYKNGLTSKALADASGSQTIAHGLGKSPTRINFHATFHSGTAISGVVHGVWDATSQNCTGLMIAEGTTSATADASFTNATALKISDVAALSDFQVGTVSVDATNITIAWVKTNNPSGTWNILWEAQA